MILVVDDLRSPVGWEDNPTKYPAPIIIARNSDEGIAALKDRPHYHAIYLDFDLGTLRGTLDDTRPIIDVLLACAIAHNPYPVDLVVAHSSNYWGRQMVVEQLSPYYTVAELPWATSEGLIA